MYNLGCIRQNFVTLYIFRSQDVVELQSYTHVIRVCVVSIQGETSRVSIETKTTHLDRNSEDLKVTKIFRHDSEEDYINTNASSRTATWTISLSIIRI